MRPIHPTPAADTRSPEKLGPRRRDWLMVTLRRTVFWLALLSGLMYAGQMWWTSRGGQPVRHTPPVAGASAATPAQGPASGVAAALAPSVPVSATSMATTPAVPMVQLASAPSQASSATSAAAISPVTEAEIAELAARKLLVPVDGIQIAQLQDTYTQSRGSERLHEAMDIMAPAGTPVRAVENGRIVKVFTSQAGGLTLYQFDPSGRFGYYYAHLQGYAEGMRDNLEVKRGDVIGYVGSTGNANPAAPHLHFAVFKLGPERKWWQGAYLNPYRLWR